MTVDDLQTQSEWPRGIYLFTDTDRMTPSQLAVVQWLYDRLKSEPEAFAVLNNPLKVLGRYDLLRQLHDLGINDFNVYRLSDLPAPVKFPVFLRHENLHQANISPILYTQAELDDAIARLLATDDHRDDYLVVEYIDYKDDDGLFRKYAAQKIGPHVFGKHLMVGRHWMIKRRTSRRRYVAGDEFPYVRNFPHHRELEKAFKISGHDWGRVDYSFYRGRVQIWEVNSNPELGTKWKRDFFRWFSNMTIFTNFDRALADVAKNITPGPAVKLSVPERCSTESLNAEKSEKLTPD